MKKPGPFLVNWSASQAIARYESLADAVQINQRAFRENGRVDFVPIAVFDTMEEANAYFEQHRAEFERRYDARRKERGL